MPDPTIPMTTGSDEADDETCTGCWGTGWNGNMEQVCDCQPKLPDPILTNVEPSHVQITALENDKWGWVVWFGGDAHPSDRDGIADTLADAFRQAQEAARG